MEDSNNYTNLTNSDLHKFVMAQVKEDDRNVMKDIDRLVNLAFADNWLVDKAINRLKVLTATPMFSERTFSTAKAIHDKMILDTQKCGNYAEEAKDCIQYLSDEFPLAKKTEILIKITTCQDEINKIL